jgi:hypothetical protein
MGKTMRKVKHTGFGPDVYALIQKAQMSEFERQRAINAMQMAEGFANALLWVREKVAAMGTWFLKPSVKH